MAPAAVLQREDERSAHLSLGDLADGHGAGSDLAKELMLQTSATREWVELGVARRLTILRRARVLMAERAETFADAVSDELARSHADTLVAEVLPLLAAIRFLERDAAKVLATRHAGVSGRPLWLGRVVSDVERVPLGRVLVIAVSNYPLLLPGVQVAQALAAGNAVIWKPGRGGRRVAMLFTTTLREQDCQTECWR